MQFHFWPSKDLFPPSTKKKSIQVVVVVDFCRQRMPTKLLQTVHNNSVGLSEKSLKTFKLNNNTKLSILLEGMWIYRRT